MTISTDLFKAILAMDSYNRGYDEGLELAEISDASGINIGTATIVNSDKSNDARAAGFYAIAYETGHIASGGQTVIAYRGTDDPLADLPAWTTGGGVDDGSPLRQSASDMT